MNESFLSDSSSFSLATVTSLSDMSHPSVNAKDSDKVVAEVRPTRAVLSPSKFPSLNIIQSVHDSLQITLVNRYIEDLKIELSETRVEATRWSNMCDSMQNDHANMKIKLDETQNRVHVMNGHKEAVVRTSRTRLAEEVARSTEANLKVELLEHANKEIGQRARHSEAELKYQVHRALLRLTQQALHQTESLLKGPTGPGATEMRSWLKTKQELLINGVQVESQKLSSQAEIERLQTQLAVVTSQKDALAQQVRDMRKELTNLRTLELLRSKNADPESSLALGDSGLHQPSALIRLDTIRAIGEAFAKLRLARPKTSVRPQIASIRAYSQHIKTAVEEFEKETKATIRSLQSELTDRQSAHKSILNQKDGEINFLRQELARKSEAKYKQRTEVRNFQEVQAVIPKERKEAPEEQKEPPEERNDDLLQEYSLLQQRFEFGLSQNDKNEEHETSWLHGEVLKYTKSMFASMQPQELAALRIPLTEEESTPQQMLSLCAQAVEELCQRRMKKETEPKRKEPPEEKGEQIATKLIDSMNAKEVVAPKKVTSRYLERPVGALSLVKKKKTSPAAKPFLAFLGEFHQKDTLPSVAETPQQFPSVAETPQQLQPQPLKSNEEPTVSLSRSDDVKEAIDEPSFSEPDYENVTKTYESFGFTTNVSDIIDIQPVVLLSDLDSNITPPLSPPMDPPMEKRPQPSKIELHDNMNVIHRNTVPWLADGDPQKILERESLRSQQGGAFWNLIDDMPSIISSRRHNARDTSQKACGTHEQRRKPGITVPIERPQGPSRQGPVVPPRRAQTSLKEEHPRRGSPNRREFVEYFGEKRDNGVPPNSNSSIVVVSRMANANDFQLGPEVNGGDTSAYNLYAHLPKSRKGPQDVSPTRQEPSPPVEACSLMHVPCTYTMFPPVTHTAKLHAIDGSPTTGTKVLLKSHVRYV